MAKKTAALTLKTTSLTPAKLARIKHVMRHCVYCGKETKMAIMGEVQHIEGKRWFKCTRCRHMSLLEMALNSAIEMHTHIDVTQCTPYNPEMVYSIGQFIFHSDWNDTGCVMSKSKTSSGGNAIIVRFENHGQKTLIENFKG
ncbi:MAG: hypothetical protein FJ218_05880 [Ignavibacteria bacterium]|nr:hypothetical protein [Ignavibacteria bacterium]